MHARFIVEVVASLGLFTLGFEASGAESQGPEFSTLSRDSKISSSHLGITLRFRALTLLSIAEE